LEIKKDPIQHQVTKAKKGNQIAFNFLLDEFWGSVYHFQLQKIQNENDAEDITIQTFSKAFDKIATYNDEYKFKTWLISISKNVYIDFLRKKKTTIATKKTEKKELHAIVDDSQTPEDKIITAQNLARLLQDIKQLKPKYQEVIHLRFFQELSYKEISTEISEPINNVKIKLLRAKKLLAAIIKKK